MKTALGFLTDRITVPVVTVCAVILAFAFSGTVSSARAEPPHIPLTTEPVAFHLERPELDKVGRLTYLGGLRIESDDARFGGLSGLRVSPDGTVMLAITDRGAWFGARIVHENGQLADVRDGWMAAMRDTTGRNMEELPKPMSDAEALTEIPGMGLVVAFEGEHRLWYYPAGLHDAYKAKRARDLPLPVDFVKAIGSLPRNTGIESFGSLPDGSMIVIAEGGAGKDNATVPAWVVGAGHLHHLTYRVHNDFSPTDLTVLPDGSVLVLERRFTLLQGLATRIRLISAAEIEASINDTDTPLDGERIATFAFPFNTDNMEGISARQDDQGRTLIYIVSDDNFLAVQRTLLMMFRLEKEAHVSDRDQQTFRMAQPPNSILNIRE